MKIIRKLLFGLILSAYLISCSTNKPNEISRKYEADFAEIIKLRDDIKDIHPFLNNLYPIVIVENDSCYVFDIDSVGERYELIKRALNERSYPQNMRAAFPVDVNNYQIGCVMTGDLFISDADYTVVFHEFIHCNQWTSCEMKLKEQLELARKAMAANDYMWELNHPFPYNDNNFVKIYSQLADAFEKKDSEKVVKLRSQLRNSLSLHDYEYLCWQEWKEGFARFIENKIRKRMGLQENHSGLEMPFSRVTFYEGGSKYIHYLCTQKNDLDKNVEELFSRILTL